MSSFVFRSKTASGLDWGKPGSAKGGDDQKPGATQARAPRGATAEAAAPLVSHWVDDLSPEEALDGLDTSSPEALLASVDGVKLGIQSQLSAFTGTRSGGATTVDDEVAREQGELTSARDDAHGRLEADFAARRLELEQAAETQIATVEAGGSASANGVEEVAIRQANELAELARTGTDGARADAAQGKGELDSHAADQALRASAEADRQRQLTSEAAAARHSAHDAAARARAEGHDLALQLRAAGTLRMTQLFGRPDEMVAAVNESNARAAQVERLAEARAHEIEERAERAVEQAAARAQAGNDKLGDGSELKGRAIAAGETIDKRLQATEGRVTGRVNAAGRSMDSEVGSLTERKNSEISKIRSSLEAGRKRLEAEKQRAEQRLDEELAERLRAIDALARRARRRQAAGQDAGDLLGQIDASSVSLGHDLDLVVSAAEAHADDKMGAQKRAMAAQARRSLAALDALAARVRRHVDAAARAGKAAIEHDLEGEKRSLDALVEQTAGKIDHQGDQVVSSMAAAGESTRHDITAMLDQSDREIVKLEGRLGGEMNEAVTEDVLAHAGAALGGEVTPEEAVEALNTLSGLPQELQRRAVERLPRKQFNALLDKLPPARRLELDALFESTQDPERKLLLWGEVHKARAVAQFAERKAAVSADAALAADEKTRRNDQSDAIVAGTEREVDAEVTHLLKKIKHAKTGDVEELAHRKEHELEIERRYNIQLTNDEDKRGTADEAPTHRAVWTEPELAQVEGVLAKLPKEHVEGNPELGELHRAKVHYDWDDEHGRWKKDTWTGGQAGGQVVDIYDSGVKDSMRHTGESSALAGHGPMTPLEEVLAHEIGHTVGYAHEKEFGELKATAKWASYDKAEVIAALEKEGMTAAEAEKAVKTLDKTRDKDYFDRNVVFPDGTATEFEVDPYSDTGYLSHDYNAIPAKDDYAHVAEDEHWAEMYMTAVQQPEFFKKVMIDGMVPKRLEAAQGLTQALINAALATTEAEKTAAQAALVKAQKWNDEVLETITQRQQQFDIMRNEVFDTDAAVAQKESELAAASAGVSGGDAAARALRIKRYVTDAAAAVTPDQAERMKQEALKDIEKL